MKKLGKAVLALATSVSMLAGTVTVFAEEDTEETTEFDFDVDDLSNYIREYKSTSIGACSTSSAKTYEDYRLITSTGSKQYQYIHNHMTVDDETGLLYDEDGFIGVALAYSFGEIGTRYYVVLDTGNIIPIVKVDAKAAVDASNGCSANDNASVIEFVINTEKAMAYFGSANGLASNGNFNNYPSLRGNIVDIELVSDEKIEEGIQYEASLTDDATKSDEQGDDVRIIEGSLSKMN